MDILIYILANQCIGCHTTSAFLCYIAQYFTMGIEAIYAQSIGTAWKVCIWIILNPTFNTNQQIGI